MVEKIGPKESAPIEYSFSADRLEKGKMEKRIAGVAQEKMNWLSGEIGVGKNLRFNHTAIPEEESDIPRLL